MAVLTIRNYRCFTDEYPAKIELGKGFTALVGPNNSGKSSLLKLFLELSSVWNLLSTPGNLLAWLEGGSQNISFNEVYDPGELFCDSNQRPMILEIDLGPDPKQQSSIPHIQGVTLSCGRDKAMTAKFDFRPDGRINIPFERAQYGFDHDIIRNIGAGAGTAVATCTELFRFVHNLSNTMYIGPFRNALNTGGGVYYGLSIGTEFIRTWHEWKTGANKGNARAIERVTEDIRRIFGFTKLEIAASLELNTLQVNVDGRPYKLRELGAGLSQFIVVFGTAAFRQPSYILIDEPELNLHPALQIDFLTSLASYAREGVTFATHSIGLARAVGDRIFSLQKKSDRVHCRLFEQTPNYAEFAGELSFSSFKELGCSQILLVEGVSDVKTVQQFLRMINMDHQVVILPLGGDQLAKGNMELELAELKRITPNVAALVDSEREARESPPQTSKQEFAESCRRLEFKVCLTTLRAIENYLTDRAIKRIKGEKYAALEPYQRLKDSPTPWAKHESWRIAREMTWDELKATDIGEFLIAL